MKNSENTIKFTQGDLVHMIKEAAERVMKEPINEISSNLMAKTAYRHFKNNETDDSDEGMMERGRAVDLNARSYDKFWEEVNHQFGEEMTEILRYYYYYCQMTDKVDEMCSREAIEEYARKYPGEEPEIGAVMKFCRMRDKFLTAFE